MGTGGVGGCLMLQSGAEYGHQGCWWVFDVTIWYIIWASGVFVGVCCYNQVHNMGIGGGGCWWFLVFSISD